MTSFIISSFIDKITLQTNKDRDLRYMILQDILQQIIYTLNIINGNENVNMKTGTTTNTNTNSNTSTTNTNIGTNTKSKNVRANTITTIIATSFPTPIPAFDPATEKRLYRMLLYFYVTGQEDISELALRCLSHVLFISRIQPLLEIITELLTHRISPSDIHLQFPSMPNTNSNLRNRNLNTKQSDYQGEEDVDDEAIPESPVETIRKRQQRAQSALIAIFSAIAPFDSVVVIAEEVIPYIIKSTTIHNNNADNKHDDNIAFSVDMVTLLSSLLQSKASLLSLHFSSLLDFLVGLLLSSSSPLLVNACSTCISVLAPHMSSSLRDSIISMILTISSSPKESQYFSKFSLIESITASCSHFFDRAAPQILSFLKLYLVDPPTTQHQQHEFGFLALDSLIQHSLPICLPLLSSVVLQSVQACISYDPNVVGMEDEDDIYTEESEWNDGEEEAYENYNQEDEYEHEDEYINDDEAGDGLDVEDDSWRARRAVVKMLLSMIETITIYTENVIAKDQNIAGSTESIRQIQQIINEILPLLVLRCHERVKHICTNVYIAIRKSLLLCKLLKFSLSNTASLRSTFITILQKLPKTTSLHTSSLIAEQVQLLSEYFLAFSSIIEVLPTPSVDDVTRIIQYTVTTQDLILSIDSIDVSLAFLQYYISLWKYYPSHHWFSYMQKMSIFISSSFSNQSTSIIIRALEAFDVLSLLLSSSLSNQRSHEHEHARLTLEYLIHVQLDGDSRDQNVITHVVEYKSDHEILKKTICDTFEHLVKLLSLTALDRRILHHALSSLAYLIHQYSDTCFGDHEILTSFSIIAQYIMNPATRSQAILSTIRILQAIKTRSVKVILSQSESSAKIFEALLSNLQQSDRLLQHRSLFALDLFASVIISHFEALSQSTNRSITTWNNIPPTVLSLSKSIINSFATFATIFIHAVEWVQEMKAILLLFSRLFYIPSSIEQCRSNAVQEVHIRILNPLIILPTLIAAHMDALAREIYSIPFALLQNFEPNNASNIFQLLRYPATVDATIWLSVAYARASISTGSCSSIFFSSFDKNGCDSDSTKNEFSLQAITSHIPLNGLTAGTTLLDSAKSTLDLTAALHLGYISSERIQNDFQCILMLCTSQSQSNQIPVPTSNQDVDRLFACALAILLKEYSGQCLLPYIQVLSRSTPRDATLKILLPAFDIALDDILNNSIMTDLFMLTSDEQSYTYFSSISKSSITTMKDIFDSLTDLFDELLRLLPHVNNNLEQTIFSVFTKIWLIYPSWKINVTWSTDVLNCQIKSKQQLLLIYSHSKSLRRNVDNQIIINSLQKQSIIDKDKLLSLLTTSSSLSVIVTILQFISTLSNFPQILKPIASSVLVLLLTNITVKKGAHSRLVTFGPIRKRVDEGVESRAQAWQTIGDIVATLPFHQLQAHETNDDTQMHYEMSHSDNRNSVDPSMITTAIQRGLNDEYDVKVIVLELLVALVKWIPMNPEMLMSLCESLVASQCSTTTTSHIDDVRHEVEGIENLTHTAMKTFGSLLNWIQQGNYFSIANVEKLLNSSPIKELQRLSC